MRQKLITLCPVTWELAQKKTNFSAWIRDQLRSERMKRELKDVNYDTEQTLNANVIERYSKIESNLPITNRELLFHLEKRSESEIKALVAILQNGFTTDETDEQV